MATYDYDCPEDVNEDNVYGDVNYLEVECWAHAKITCADASPKDKNGNSRSNAIVELTMEVLAATEQGQEGKVVKEIIWGPKLDATDGGKFARRKIGRLAIATGLVDENSKGKRVSVDFSKLEGRQMIVQFKLDSDEKKYMGIAFADMYHIDDPRKKNVPRDQTAIGFTPGGQEAQPEQSEFDSL